MGSSSSKHNPQPEKINLLISTSEVRMKCQDEKRFRGNKSCLKGSFTIHNPTSETFIFKIETTVPRNMVVGWRPNNGTLLPGSTVKVSVLISYRIGVPPPVRHNLLVVSGVIESGQGYHQDLWKDAKLKADKKILCIYEDAHPTDPDTESFESTYNTVGRESDKDANDVKENNTETSASASAAAASPGSTPPPYPDHLRHTFNMTQAGVTRANDLYREVQSKTIGMSRPVKRKKLEEANRIYEQELRRYAVHGQGMHAIPSILRNQGMTNLRLADVVDCLDPLQEFQLVTYHLKEAVRCFTQALTLRPEEQTGEWGLGVQEKIVDCIDIGLRRAANREFQSHRVVSHELGKVVEAIPNGDVFNPVRTKCYLAKSQGFYNRAVVSLERLDFRTTIQFLEYAREEKEMAANFASGNVELLQEIKIIESDILVHQCWCESVRVRSQADELFNSQINEAENIDMRMMWTICDMYKEAVILTREMDIESEAFALCRLGRMYDKVFKLKGKAHAYYRQGFDLLQTLFPKHIQSAWFVECKEALERFQRNVVLEEQKRDEEERAPILEKLKPQLAEVRKANRDGVQKLLKLLYKNYPPKVKYEFKEEELENPVRHKAVLMKAITYYHPDRQVNFGLDWKVFCCEITKILTVRYETYK